MAGGAEHARLEEGRCGRGEGRRGGGPLSREAVTGAVDDGGEWRDRAAAEVAGERRLGGWRCRYGDLIWLGVATVDVW
jgi:hypothetical protein